MNRPESSAGASRATDIERAELYGVSSLTRSSPRQAGSTDSGAVGQHDPWAVMQKGSAPVSSTLQTHALGCRRQPEIAHVVPVIAASPETRCDVERGTRVIGDKVEHFEGKAASAVAVQSHLEEYLKTNGFTLQTSAPSAQGVVIQAKKGGFLRGIVDADRALTITISANADDLTVRVGVGKWLEHLGVAVIETLLLSDLFFVVDVAESAWNLEIEDKLLKDLKAFVG
jgi:hypothetical protein